VKRREVGKAECAGGTRFERAAARYRARLDMSDPRARLMAASYAGKAEMLGVVFRAVCSVTDPAGVAPMTRFWYQGLGRETYKLWQGRNRPEQAAELELVARKWVVRGLEPELVSRVQASVLAALNDAAPSPTSHENTQASK